MAGHQVLERPAGPLDLARPVEEIAAAIEPHRHSLVDAGLEVRGVAVSSGTPEVGAAALAGIGSGLLKSWDHYYAGRKEGP
jgi:hypothetical protein